MFLPFQNSISRHGAFCLALFGIFVMLWTAPLFGQEKTKSSPPSIAEKTAQSSATSSKTVGKSSHSSAAGEAFSLVSSTGDTLFQVEGNGRVGIGTATPGNTLDVAGTVSATNFQGDGSGLTNLPNVSPWTSAGGGNLYYTGGRVGIGDATPVSTFTVGDGDKFQVNGTDGDLYFNDDQASIRFASTSGANAPMIQMFNSGTNNSLRMLVAHSPSFPNWGIQYNDTSDAFTYIGDNLPVLHIGLAGQQRVGIGTRTPEAKFHVETNSSTGFGQIKLTESQYDFSRITMDNTINSGYWEIAARGDTDTSSANYHIYNNLTGNLMTVNARGRVGINDATPSYTLDINADNSTRGINLTGNRPTTASTTYNYGVRANLSQSANTGFPRLYNFYGISTDSDAYLSYGIYAYASGASNANYGVYAFAPTNSGYAVYASGNVYCTGSYLPSDRRLKNQISAYQDGLATVMRLRPTRYRYDRSQYDYMNLPEGEQVGFVADEVKMVLPDQVQHSFQPFEEEMVEATGQQGLDFEAVNYISLIPILTSAIQEQQKMIEVLQKRIEELEKK